ncbi:retrovirus-related pol polyprotein from transposon TNT 1-94 [Tanacetum coccineum]
MDDTTDQFDDEADARLEEPTETATRIIQDAHVIISTIPKKTEVPVTSSSCSSDLASKFLNFSDIPQNDAKIVSLLDVHVHHEVPRTQAPTLLTIPVSVITESLPEESNFDPPVIKKLIKESRDEVTLAKVSSQSQSTYEAASTLTEFELKKILLDKMEKSESYLTAPEHRDCYDGLKKSYALDKYFFYSYDVYSLKLGRKDKDKDEDPSAGSDRGLKKKKRSKDAEPTTGPKKKDSTSGSFKGTKSQPKSTGNSIQSKEPVFEVADSDMPQDQERNMGDNEDEPRNKTSSIQYDFEECYKALSEKLDWENPEGGDYPFDLSKPLPLIMRGKRQRVQFEYFINNDLKPMVPNIWSHVKVDSDRYRYWVSHIGENNVMRKHGYGYLEEIVVRRADNVLYRFKEGSDGADFAIALRMFTRILFDESDTYVLERFDTLAGNPVKEILLKLNLPDHRSILTDSKVTPTNHGRMTKPYSSLRFIANCFNAGYLKMEVKIFLGGDLEPDEWIKDSGCSKQCRVTESSLYIIQGYNGGQICDNKCRVTFSKHDSEITKDGKVIVRASKELVRNLPKLKFDQHFCDACKIRKQAHVSHKAKNIVSTTRCLELLHMDLFCPSAIWSYGGNLYTLVIVDDYSRTDHDREFAYEVQFGEFCNANVARLESIRILLAYSCALEFKLFKMDIKSAFLNGFINEEVYVGQPPGFIDHHHHHHRVDEMTCLNDEKINKIRNDVPCYDHFKVVEFVLGQEDA